MKLSVVIAAYDEAGSIAALFERLERTLVAMPEVTPEAIFVVEGTDGTHGVLSDLSARLPWVRILYREAPSGLGAAFRRGFAAVADDADYVVTLDADLNHRPEEIPRLLEAAIARDADVLVGSRFVAGAEVEGTPLWKRALSGGVNRLMRPLYGLAVRDKTSGFRIYRARALRRLEFGSDAFAFLPELLIAAERADFHIVEEPIHFTYRREGRSKMAFWGTSWSYLAMLTSRLSRQQWIVLALLVVAVAVRVGLTFPVGKLRSEADSVLNGLCAFRVLRGETPVFASHTRLGSIGGHLTAAVLAVGADLRLALAIGPMIEGILLIGFWYLFFCEILGRRLAAMALLFIAVPAPSYSFWTAMPNGYPEVVLTCGATLWAAARAGRAKGELWPFWAVGLASGLGLWSSLQTLGCSAPALAWLIYRCPRTLTSRAVPAMAVGFLLGAFPWLAFNLQYDFRSLRSGYATTPAPGLLAMADNASDLVTYKLPELVGSVDQRFWPRQTRPVRALHLWILGIHLLAAVVFFDPRRRAPALGRGDPPELPSAAATRVLFGLVLVTLAVLNVVSVAGMTRGVTVRYILPLYLIVPGLLAVLLARIQERSRWVAGSLAALVVAFNLAGTYLPWTAERQGHVARAAKDEQLIERLERKGVQAVVGKYWEVYPINYLSRERIRGVPLLEHTDHYRVAEQLGEEPLRWAVISGGYGKDDVVSWVEDAGIAGKKRRWPGYRVFLVRRPMPARELLSRVRELNGRKEKEKRLQAESPAGDR